MDVSGPVEHVERVGTRGADDERDVAVVIPGACHRVLQFDSGGQKAYR